MSNLFTTDPEGDFTSALDHAVSALSEHPRLYENVDANGNHALPTLKYFSFTQDIVLEINRSSDFFINPFPYDISLIPNVEYNGISIIGQLVAGFAMAARKAGESRIDCVSAAMQNPRSCQLLLQLAEGGHVAGAAEEVAVSQSRVDRAEKLLGLASYLTGDTVYDSTVYLKLQRAFQLVPQTGDGDRGAYFRVSDDVLADYASIKKIGDGEEGICPFRSYLARILRSIARGACANPSLVASDLSEDPKGQLVVVRQ